MLLLILRNYEIVACYESPLLYNISQANATSRRHTPRNLVTKVTVFHQEYFVIVRFSSWRKSGSATLISKNRQEEDRARFETNLFNVKKLVCLRIHTVSFSRAPEHILFKIDISNSSFVPNCVQDHYSYWLTEENSNGTIIVDFGCRKEFWFGPTHNHLSSNFGTFLSKNIFS